jgi:hypothetical protein
MIAGSRACLLHPAHPTTANQTSPDFAEALGNLPTHRGSRSSPVDAIYSNAWRALARYRIATAPIPESGQKGAEVASLRVPDHAPRHGILAGKASLPSDGTLALPIEV